MRAETWETAARGVLESVARAAARQRAAIMARDARAVEQAYEALLPLLADLDLIVDRTSRRQSDGSSESMSRLQSLAARVRSEIAINRSLLQTGMATADHFVAAAGAAAAAGPALFSGVG